MIFVTLYLVCILVADVGALVFLSLDKQQLLDPIRVALTCVAAGGMGGCLYCLRAVYLNACVRKNWDVNWHIWYFLRPLCSAISGGASYLFLKAGLLVLESGAKVDSSDLGFYALAFIAGLNVDKFVKKLEDIAEAVWGIEKSRTSANTDKNGGE